MDAEKYGYKWKAIIVNLPERWDFKWFQIKFFVPDKWFTQREFKNFEFLKNCKSKKDIVNFLENYREYMRAKGFNMDQGIDYSKLSMLDCDSCELWQFLIKKCELPEFEVWLNNIFVTKQGDIWVRCRNCEDGYFNFGFYAWDNYASQIIMDM